MDNLLILNPIASRLEVTNRISLRLAQARALLCALCEDEIEPYISLSPAIFNESLGGVSALLEEAQYLLDNYEGSKKP